MRNRLLDAVAMSRLKESVPGIRCASRRQQRRRSRSRRTLRGPLAIRGSIGAPHPSTGRCDPTPAIPARRYSARLAMFPSCCTCHSVASWRCPQSRSPWQRRRRCRCKRGKSRRDASASARVIRASNARSIRDLREVPTSRCARSSAPTHRRQRDRLYQPAAPHRRANPPQRFHRGRFSPAHGCSLSLPNRRAESPSYRS